MYDYVYIYICVYIHANINIYIYIHTYVYSLNMAIHGPFSLMFLSIKVVFHSYLYSNRGWRVLIMGWVTICPAPCAIVMCQCTNISVILLVRWPTMQLTWHWKEIGGIRKICLAHPSANCGSLLLQSHHKCCCVREIIPEIIPNSLPEDTPCVIWTGHVQA